MNFYDYAGLIISGISLVVIPYLYKIDENQYEQHYIDNVDNVLGGIFLWYLMSFVFFLLKIPIPSISKLSMLLILILFLNEIKDLLLLDSEKRFTICHIEDTVSDVIYGTFVLFFVAGTILGQAYTLTHHEDEYVDYRKLTNDEMRLQLTSFNCVAASDLKKWELVKLLKDNKMFAYEAKNRDPLFFAFSFILWAVLQVYPLSNPANSDQLDNIMGGLAAYYMLKIFFDFVFPYQETP
jgi:hypothetical protein